MSVNRACGLVISVLALALIAVVIPANTETVGSGWMKPDTLPLACAALLAGLGGLQAVMDPGTTDIGVRSSLRFAMVLTIVSACVFLMQFGGFVPAAILLAVLLMLACGERRPALIAVAGAGLPLVTWVIVSQLIGRPLP